MKKEKKTSLPKKMQKEQRLVDAQRWLIKESDQNLIYNYAKRYAIGAITAFREMDDDRFR
jgi:hypothetical protein